MKINLEQRTVNGKPFICEKQNVTLAECLEEIERLYRIYKYSTPGENDERRTYFYALPSEELSDEDIIFGANRYEAKIELEMYVLTMIVGGVLIWNNDVMHGNWFYKGKDPDLIILRKWID